MRHISEVLHGLKPVLQMVLVQLSYIGMNVLYKLATDDGMNLRVLIAYRWTFSAVIMAPLALIFERAKRPKLTWMIIYQAFVSGLFGGTLAQNLYLESLALTSATFATAISNLVPTVTFILAVSFGLEKVGLKTPAGKAKVLGTLIGIGGAMFFTCYKGVEINFLTTNAHLLKHNHGDGQLQKRHTNINHILGSLMAFGSCFSYSAWLIIQTKISKRYPCHYTSTALMSLMAAIQCVIFSLCMERNRNQWKLGWNIRLLTVSYSGIVTSGMVVALIAWCVSMRGPVFVASFGPLSLVLITIIGSLLLDEKMHLGSILGAVLIVCGLYMVLWGQSKERKEKAQLVPTKSSHPTTTTELVEVVANGNQPASNDSTRGDGGSLPKEGKSNSIK